MGRLPRTDPPGRAADLPAYPGRDCTADFPELNCEERGFDFRRSGEDAAARRPSRRGGATWPSALPAVDRPSQRERVDRAQNLHLRSDVRLAHSASLPPVGVSNRSPSPPPFDVGQAQRHLTPKGATKWETAYLFRGFRLSRRLARARCLKSARASPDRDAPPRRPCQDTITEGRRRPPVPPPPAIRWRRSSSAA